MRKGLWIWLAVVILPLSGCESNGFLPYARELEHMALMETMGVDATGDNVTVTLSTGVQSGENVTEPPLVLSATAQSISGSCHNLQSQGSSYVYYGHVGQVLIGEDLATTDITPVLDYVLQDVEMRLDTYLYIVEGDAKTAMEGVSGENKSAPDRLEAMEDGVGLVDSFTPITVGDTISRLNRSGAVTIPALKVEEGELVSAGYGIIKEGALLGYIQGESAKGTDLLMEEVTADIVEVTDATLRVVGSEVEITPNFQGSRLTSLTITCEVEANIAELARGVSAVNEDELGAWLATIERERIWSALHSAIELDADFLELELQATIAQPWHRDEIENQWSLQDIPIEVTVVGVVNGEL